MFKRFYTTSMSASKKELQARFMKIRSDTGKMARMMSLVMAAALIFVTAFAAVVMAAVEAQNTDSIMILYNGKEQAVNHTPFEYEQEIYVPLRDVLKICGIGDENISYDNGEITVTFTPENFGGSSVRATIRINQSGIVFDRDSEYRIMGIKGARSTTHPALLADGTTYIPAGMVLRMKNYYIAEDYDDRVYLDLLGKLEIRRYDSEGKYDAVISGAIDVNNPNKYDPSSYCGRDEKVVIGTAEDFNAEQFGHTEINGYYYPVDAKKHILVDENGRVQAVMPYESFRHESVNPTGGGTSSWKTIKDYEDDSLTRRRGGFNIFMNVWQPDGNGGTRSRCLDYCFADFRYFVK